MKKLLFFILILCSASVMAQTYDPTQGTVSNKPYAPAQAIPTDSRSMYYDIVNFVWRPYQSTTEVLSYLNLSKYRTGNFSIYVNPTGVLNGNGTFTGGYIAEYWFKNGVANSNLVIKADTTKVPFQTLADTAAAIRSVIPRQFNPTAGSNMTITGTYPNLTFNSILGGGTVTNVATAYGLLGGSITTTGTLLVDSLLITSRQRLQKVADSLAALISGGGFGSVTSVSGGYGLTGGPITVSGTLTPDTGKLTSKLDRNKLKDSLSAIIATKGSVILVSSGIGMNFPAISSSGAVDADTVTVLSTKLNSKKNVNDSSLALRNSRHYVNVESFGAVHDGVTSDVAAIQNANAYALTVGKDLYFPAGIYQITTFLSVNLTNMRWFGQDSLSVLRGALDSVIKPTAFTNSTIEHLWITTQKVSTSQSGVGLIVTRGIDVIGNTIQFTKFTCPTANTDALCFLINMDSTVTQHWMVNNNFRFNKLQGIGRIGFDIFNRKFTLTAHANVANNHIDYNYCDSTGAKGSFGMLVSFDGAGQSNTVNYNEINNMLSAGVEVQAHYSTEIMGNRIYYTTRSFTPISITSQTSSAYGLKIGNNTSFGANTYWTFFNMNQSHVFGNHAYAALNTSANDGTFYFIGSSYNIIDGNYISGSTGGIRISSQPTAGTYFNLPSTGNQIKNNTIWCTVGTTAKGLIKLDSSLTTYNVVTSNSLFKALDSGYFVISDGSVSNSTCGNYKEQILDPCGAAGGVDSIAIGYGLLSGIGPTGTGTISNYALASVDTGKVASYQRLAKVVDSLEAVPDTAQVLQMGNLGERIGYADAFYDTLKMKKIIGSGMITLVTSQSGGVTTDSLLTVKYGNGSGTPTTNTLGTNVSSATITGVDHGFKIVIVTSGNVSGSICNIAFANTWSTAPVVVMNPFGVDATTSAAVTKTYVGVTSTTSASFGGTITGAGTYTFNMIFVKPVY